MTSLSFYCNEVAQKYHVTVWRKNQGRNFADLSKQDHVDKTCGFTVIAWMTSAYMRKDYGESFHDHTYMKFATFPATKAFH